MYGLLKNILGEVVILMKWINVLLRVVAWRLTVRPRGFGVRRQVKEEFIGMAQVFTYKQGLLTPPAGVESQRIVVTVDGVAGEPIAVAADATDVEFKAGPAGVTVNLVLDYLDSAGNDSGNFEQQFVIVDGVPPEAPQGFGELTQIAEEEV